MSEAGNVVLIGMPGAGKSTLGVVLAKMLGKDFIDCDLLIQGRCKRRLQQLIDQQGVDGFLSIENEVLSSIDATNSIIATGGSAVYSPQAMKHLATQGPIVYLRISYDSLQKRLGDLRERGVVMREGASDSLHDLYCERESLYEEYATLVVDVDGLTVSEAVSQVSQAGITVKHCETREMCIR